VNTFLKRESPRLSFPLAVVAALFAAIALASCSNAASSSDSSSSSVSKASSSSSSGITAIVLDSVGGSAIDGATITVTDSNNNSVNLGTTNTTGSDGTLSLTNYLDFPRYGRHFPATIVAKGGSRGSRSLFGRVQTGSG